MTDPIADFLTRIRNAVKANHKVVEAPGSKIKQEMTKILYEQGYILAYKFDKDEKGHPSIKIALKWDPATKTNAGSAPLCVGFGHAPRFERPGHRHRFHVERHHDRRQGPSGERGRRGAVLYLLIANH
jgi:hypothetical protein